MRKLPAVATIVLAALALGSASPLLLKGQNNGAGAGNFQGAAVDDMPHRTAKAFAPFIRAIVQRRINTATQIFKLHRSVETSLEQAETVRILGRFQKPDRLDLNLIGGRTLGQNIGILMFTVATQDGPVAFKIYYYGFGPDIYISRIDITDDWDTMEQTVIGLEALTNPITVSLGQIDEGGQ